MARARYVSNTWPNSRTSCKRLANKLQKASKRLANCLQRLVFYDMVWCQWQRCKISPAKQPPHKGGHIEEGEGEAGGQQAVEEPRPPQRGRLSVTLKAGTHEHHSEGEKNGK